MTSLRKKINAHKIATLFLCGVVLSLTAVVGIVLAYEYGECPYNTGMPDMYGCGQKYEEADENVGDANLKWEDLSLELKKGPPKPTLEEFIDDIGYCGLYHGCEEDFWDTWDDAVVMNGTAQDYYDDIDTDRLTDANAEFIDGKDDHDWSQCNSACYNYHAAKSHAYTWMNQDDVIDTEEAAEWAGEQAIEAYALLLMNGCNCGW